MPRGVPKTSMKVTTLTRHNLKDGMIVEVGKDKFYIHQAVHNNDDSTLLRGNFTGFHGDDTASIWFHGQDRVRIFLEE